MSRSRSLAIDVGKALLSHIAKTNGFVITYGELAKLLPYEFNPRNLDTPLGDLSALCQTLNLPLISTIVVSQDTYLPGAGYYKCFFGNAKPDRWKAIFDKEYKLVRNCGDWSLLANELGISSNNRK